jgi:hypothetical protein
MVNGSSLPIWPAGMVVVDRTIRLDTFDDPSAELFDRGRLELPKTLLRKNTAPWPPLEAGKRQIERGGATGGRRRRSPRSHPGLSVCEPRFRMSRMA